MKRKRMSTLMMRSGTMRMKTSMRMTTTKSPMTMDMMITTMSMDMMMTEL